MGMWFIRCLVTLDVAIESFEAAIAHAVVNIKA